MPVPEMAVSPVKAMHWEKLPPMAQCRVYSAPVYHEGLLYVLGGCSESGMPLDSVEVLDVESQTWSQIPPLPTARAGASAVLLGGQVMVLGGMNQQQTPLASVEVYHPDEGKWESKASLSQPSMGVTTLKHGRRTRAGRGHEGLRGQVRSLTLCWTEASRAGSVETVFHTPQHKLCFSSGKLPCYLQMVLANLPLSWLLSNLGSAFC